MNFLNNMILEALNILKFFGLAIWEAWYQSMFN